jgi:hypothetical protein
MPKLSITPPKAHGHLDEPVFPKAANNLRDRCSQQLPLVLLYATLLKGRDCLVRLQQLHASSTESASPISKVCSEKLNLHAWAGIVVSSVNWEALEPPTTSFRVPWPGRWSTSHHRTHHRASQQPLVRTHLPNTEHSSPTRSKEPIIRVRVPPRPPLLPSKATPGFRLMMKHRRVRC